MKIRTKNARKATTMTKALRVTSFSDLPAVFCWLARLLSACVEPNPRPVTPTENPDKTPEHHSDSPSAVHSEVSVSGSPNGSSSTETNFAASHFLQYLQALTYARTRLEEGQRQLTNAMKQRFAKYPSQPGRETPSDGRGAARFTLGYR